MDMEQGTPTEQDRSMARRCLDCPVCDRARRHQRGFAYWFVRRIEGGICPYCRAYERVYGRKAHEPIPSDPADSPGPGTGRSELS
jgi:hypothetical protein